MLKFGDTFFSEIEGRDLVFDEDSTQHLSPVLKKSPSDLANLAALYTAAAAKAEGKVQKTLRGYWMALLALQSRVAEVEPGQVALLRPHDLRVRPPELTGRLRRDVSGHLRTVLKEQKGLERGLSAESAFLAGFASYLARVGDDPKGPAVVLIDYTAKKKEPVIYLNYRVRLPNVNILILDATGTKEHYEALLGRPVEVLEGFVEHPSEIVQYTDRSFSLAALARNKPQNRDYAAALVKKLATEHRLREDGTQAKVLLVTHNKRRKTLGAASGIGQEDIAHFQSM